MKTKYVAFVNEFGADDMIIFSETQNHAELARRLVFSPEILGAGFLYITTEDDKPGVHCYGKSESLEIESRGLLDSAIAHRILDIY